MLNKPETLLLIGSAGLIGGNILQVAARYSCKVIPSFHSYFPSGYSTGGLRLDITEPDLVTTVLDATQPRCVVNLSCMPVAHCERDPEKAYRVQVEGVRNLARACRERRVRLIHFSSDMVYSGEKGAPYTLDDEPDPISVYGKTKYEGEKAVEAVGGDYVIVRCGLVLCRGQFRKGGFLEWMMAKAIRDERIPLFIDQLRTPIVIDDLIDAVFCLITSPFCGILLAGGDQGLSRVEMGKKLLSVMGKTGNLIEPVSVNTLKADVPIQKDLRMDNTRFREVTGKEKLMGIEEYFRKVVV